jgi:hypothetical protein
VLVIPVDRPVKICSYVYYANGKVALTIAKKMVSRVITRKSMVKVELF